MLVNLVFTVLLMSAVCKGDDDVEYYEDLINTNVAGALSYEFETDAAKYEPEDKEITDFGLYDYVIIGAGSSGSVMASRLSEIKKFKVLLLEAGKEPNNFTMIPAYFALNSLTEYNWGFKTKPQEHACLGNIDNACRVPRGRGLGGTTLLSEMVYCRGDPMLYDKWANVLNDSSWSFENILDYFKKSEDFHKTNPNAPVDQAYHAQGGYLNVNFHVPPSNMSPIYLEANRLLGRPILDYNGQHQVSATILQLNTKNGRRLDQVTAFIKPVSYRKNLVISKESFVTKIRINKETKITEGVIFTKNNKTFIARIKREVILSAGVISSPHILMLSGIGPESHLKDHGIPVVQDLEVGSTLRDHVFVNLMFSSNVTKSDETLKKQIQDYIKGYGSLTAANLIDSAGFFQTQTETVKNYPNLEIVFSSSSPSALGKKFLNWKDETYQEIFNLSIESTFMLTSVLYNSKSVGSVRLVSNNPYDYPEIDGNYLNDLDNEDIKTIYDGIQTSIELTQTLPFQKIAANLEVRQLPACQHHEFLSKPFWFCYIRHTSQSAYHPMGTCPMGEKPEEGAVVDTNGKVHGVKKLRVVDSSVFPFVMTGQPNAICTMIAEKISDVIKREQGVLPL